MGKDNDFVAMPHTLCPCCRKKEEFIVIDTRLRDISKIHNQAVGMSEKPCSDCQAIIDKGYVRLVVIDEQRSGKNEGPADAYYTGMIADVKKEAWDRIFVGALPPKIGVGFIPLEVADLLHLDTSSYDRETGKKRT